MKTKILVGSFSAAALLFSMPSFSNEASHGVLDDDNSGLTIRPVIEYDFKNEGEFTTGGGNTGTFEFEKGFGLGVDIGLPIDIDNIELEANVRYRTNELESVKYNAFTDANDNKFNNTQLAGLNNAVKLGGDVKQFSAGVSARYNIDMDNSKIRPYIGGGLHASYIKLDGVTLSAGDHSASYDDGDIGFGMTFGAGVDFAISDNTSLTVGYQYRHEFEREFTGTSGGESSKLTADKFASHAIMAGINIRF